MRCFGRKRFGGGARKQAKTNQSKELMRASADFSTKARAKDRKKIVQVCSGQQLLDCRSTYMLSFLLQHCNFLKQLQSIQESWLTATIQHQLWFAVALRTSSNHHMFSFPRKWSGREMEQRFQLFYLDIKGKNHSRIGKPGDVAGTLNTSLSVLYLQH